jgi:hypothetical protein
MPVWYLSSQLSELNRTELVERRMTPDRVVEAVHAAANRLLSFGSRLEDGEPKPPLTYLSINDISSETFIFEKAYFIEIMPHTFVAM